MNNTRFIHKIKKECDIPTTFIILCGRKSNKRGYKNIPLTPISNNQTLIDKQINIIDSNYKDYEIIIISGFEHEKIVNHIHKSEYTNIRIAENKDYKSSNAFDGWRFALNIALAKDTYIIHGDRLFSDSFIKGKTKNTHTFIHDLDKNNYDLGLSIKDEMFVNMSYGLPNVWSEIFFINKSDFNLIRNIANQYKQRKIYNIECFLNILSKHINISVINQNSQEIKILKEI